MLVFTMRGSRVRVISLRKASKTEIQRYGQVKLNPDDYDNKPIDDDENPEWTEEDFAEAKPFKEVFAKQYANWEARGRASIPVRRVGRPPVDQPKVHVGFRLARDVVDGIRATGKGYNARVERVLREALEAGRLLDQAPRPPRSVD